MSRGVIELYRTMHFNNLYGNLEDFYFVLLAQVGNKMQKRKC